MAIESFFSLGNRILAGAKKDFWEFLNRIPEHHPKMPHKINGFPGKPGFSQKFVDFTIFFSKNLFFSIDNRNRPEAKKKIRNRNPGKSFLFFWQSKVLIEFRREQKKRFSEKKI